MMISPPGSCYLLTTQTRWISEARGCWRFTLERSGGKEHFGAADEEACECAERLELLALVRGLEALDEPARVTLVTGSRYVLRGLKFGLADWKSNGWTWERFGDVAPVRDHDLWRRVDRALAFHQLVSRRRRRVGAAARSFGQLAAHRWGTAATESWRRVAEAAQSWANQLQPAELVAG